MRNICIKDIEDSNGQKDNDLSTFWDISRFPKNRDGSTCYVSILGFWKDFWCPKFYDPHAKEHRPGNRVFRRYFPATEEGMSGIRELIDSNKFEALYRSQAFFPKIRKTQRKEDISAISHAWLDLDINKIGEKRRLIKGDKSKGLPDRWVDNNHYRPDLFSEWQALDDAGKAEWLVQYCVTHEIPEPTEVVLSGGGAYLLWQFTDTVFISRRRRKAGQTNQPRSYIDVIEDIHRNLRNRLDYLMAAGIGADRFIAIDFNPPAIDVGHHRQFTVWLGFNVFRRDEGRDCFGEQGRRFHLQLPEDRGKRFSQQSGLVLEDLDGFLMPLDPGSKDFTRMDDLFDSGSGCILQIPCQSSHAVCFFDMRQEMFRIDGFILSDQRFNFEPI
ncbi:hypothetical protein [Acetobacter sp.]|uniref:hypothetical protein n=1 Tax=Acetobacter sp. TaxID=440 RepID=UPI0025BEA0B9|nr:hypothetical protein [Acetobacter sp.]MCH4092160.1 hypothetical protein [Acetobacter sp.]MCI1299923.1 hypothetical protein [Acetobacter sp.]MCI1315941.1 hypothetical protein [Acetobacter sp.]